VEFAGQSHKAELPALQPPVSVWNLRSKLRGEGAAGSRLPAPDYTLFKRRRVKRLIPDFPLFCQNIPKTGQFFSFGQDNSSFSLDFDAFSLDFDVLSSDFNALSSDFDPESLDFKPKSFGNTAFWNKNASFLIRKET
jgi:hypothetical protein